MSARVELLKQHSRQRLAEMVVELEGRVRSPLPATPDTRSMNALIQQEAAAQEAAEIVNEHTLDLPESPLFDTVILTNGARCLRCDVVAESTAPNHYVACGCGALCVSGGTKLLRRSGHPDTYEDLSVIEHVRDAPGT